jgi:hypothetical protein
MTAITSQSLSKEMEESQDNEFAGETNHRQEPEVSNVNVNERLAKIQKMKGKAEEFHEETKENIGLAANVPETFRFPRDFYLDFDDLIDEQIQIHHKTPSEAAEYAEKNYKIRNKLETDPNDSTRTYPRTTYKVTLPRSKYPDKVRYLRISSKKGIEAINDELARVAMNHDGDIYLTILRKQPNASNPFKITWEVTGQPAPAANGC